MDNAAIARILREIADLLEIKADNPFKIRAYRNGADIVSNHPHELATLDDKGLREIPGIGKDLAARILEISATGSSAYHQELVAEFAPTILDLLHLQGVGPKTVAVLYRELNVRTLDDLEQAAQSGRIRALKGMGPKKEALILKALDERKRHAGRHLLSEAQQLADTLVAFLHEKAPLAEIEAVGSLRRGCETVGDLDILASGADLSLMDAFCGHPSVERVLVHGDTKSSVLAKGGFQADLRLVASESRGAALQYFTGSKAHNIALRDRAIRRGFKLNEYGLFRTEGDKKVAGDSEQGVYEALGLDWIPPELREDRGEISAAEEHRLPRLIARSDLRGDLHTHTTETDGKDDLTTMIAAARDAGLEYIAVTDHSQALAMANGLDENRALAQAARVRALSQSQGLQLFAGIECDIRADGTMDLADDCLASLDLVIASIHSGFNQERTQMTDRLLRAIENPHVDILGHPTARALLRREPILFDVDAVFSAVAKAGIAMEINCQVHRLDLNDIGARLAKARGIPIVISTDAHDRDAFARLRWGIMMARRAWLEPGDVLNTLSFEQFRARLRRNRR